MLCKLIHTCAAEGKDPRCELNKFLLQYRAAPHLTTNKSPAEMLYNRVIKTKLPLYHDVEESKEQKEVRAHHDKKKLQQKDNFDRRRRVKHKEVKVGDRVLIKQEKSTTKPPFSPNLLTVSDVKGNQITATDGRITRKRDKNHIKVLPPRPDHLKPLWHRSAASNLSVFDYNDSAPVEPVSCAEDPSEAEQVQATQPVPERFTLQPDMADKLAHLVSNAERLAELEQTDQGETDKRITRSKGQQLAWSKKMSDKNPLMSTTDNSE